MDHDRIPAAYCHRRIILSLVGVSRRIHDGGIFDHVFFQRAVLVLEPNEAQRLVRDMSYGNTSG